MLSPTSWRGSSEANGVLEDDLHLAPVWLEVLALELGDVLAVEDDRVPP